MDVAAPTQFLLESRHPLMEHRGRVPVAPPPGAASLRRRLVLRGETPNTLGHAVAVEERRFGAEGVRVSNVGDSRVFLVRAERREEAERLRPGDKTVLRVGDEVCLCALPARLEDKCRLDTRLHPELLHASRRRYKSGPLLLPCALTFRVVVACDRPLRGFPYVTSAYEERKDPLPLQRQI